jgi:hypothetical protein
MMPPQGLTDISSQTLLSEHINMTTSFEDVVEAGSMVKRDLKSELLF